jgi:hypothetical protein
MAAKAFKGETKKRLILIIWGIAFLGVICTGISQWFNYKSQTSLQEQLDSIDKTGKDIASNIKKFISPDRMIVQNVPPEKEESLEEISKKFDELYTSITGQTWGLNKEQLKILSHRLQPYGSSKETEDLVTCVFGDSDSQKFAFNLVGAFRDAGWNLPGSGFNRAIFNNDLIGVFVVIHSKESKAPGLKEFIITLREAGIEPKGIIDINMPDDKFRIIVGRKP